MVPWQSPALHLLCPVPVWVRTLFILDLPMLLLPFLQPRLQDKTTSWEVVHRGWVRVGKGWTQALTFLPLSSGDISDLEHNPSVLEEFTISGVKCDTRETCTHTCLAEKWIQEKCVQFKAAQS